MVKSRNTKNFITVFLSILLIVTPALSIFPIQKIHAATPTISNIIPNNGSINGGTTVTINGNNFEAGGPAIGGEISYTDSNGLNPRTTSPYTDGYTVHTFNSSDTFILPSTRNVDVLVVAGGGAGAAGRGGGGGAGGLIYRSDFSVSGGSYSVVVGLGGISGSARGTNGKNSSFNSLIAIGGGSAGNSGGSGGGSYGYDSYNGYYPPGAGTSGQGYSGGTYINNNSDGGGGGGAGGIGGNKNGGVGLAYSISGISKFYAGGGGGGASEYSSGGGTGGSGIGGKGGGFGTGYSIGAGTPGLINTGSGGGAGHAENYATYYGGAGGSGIIIIRYRTQSPRVLTFDGIPATNIEFVNSNTLTATTPSHSAGSVNISITNPNNGETVNFNNGYTYSPSEVISVSPNTSLIDGGSNVTISGLNLIENSATGGLVTYTDVNGLNPRSTIPYIGGYTVHTFNSDGNFIVSSDRNVQALVVAGGGGGGSISGGGGGAGGLLYSESLPLKAGINYPVKVGSGGAGAINTTSMAVNGGNSIFSNMVAIGGGGGAFCNMGNGGSTGGSGGGSASSIVGIGIVGQGKNGSIGYCAMGGGGGGAGNSGGATTSNTAGIGGAGLQYSISGISTYYAGGGGGGSYYSYYAGSGGNGGGGAGSRAINGTGSSGVSNKGGGGGGGGTNSDSSNYGTSNGGNGGSGVVIVRYLTPNPISVTFGGVPATNIVFNSSSSITVTTPIHELGPVDILINNLNGGENVSYSNGFTYKLPGFVIKALDESLNAYLSTDWETDVLLSGQDGIKNIGIAKGETPIASIDVNFIGEPNWSGVTADVAEQKAYFHSTNDFSSLSNGQSTSYSLYVPKGDGDKVWICPGASSLADVKLSCSGGYFLSEGQTFNGATASVIIKDTVAYWKIEGLTGTGGMSVVTGLKDTLSRLQVSSPSDHTITFGTNNGITASGHTLALEFDPSTKAFDLSSLTISDIVLTDNVGNDRTLASSPTIDTWGVSIDSVNDTITFTAPTSGIGYYQAASQIVIKIGINAGGTNQISNPLSTGSYKEYITITNAETEGGLVDIPFVDSDQVMVTGYVTAYIHFDIDTATGEIPGINSVVDCNYNTCLTHENGDPGLNYTVDLGELTSAVVNKSNTTSVAHTSGGNGIINSIYFDISTNAPGGVIVSVKSTNAGLQGPGTNKIPSIGVSVGADGVTRADGQDIPANSGVYGYNLPIASSQLNGSIIPNSLCDSAVKFCGPDLTTKTVFTTNNLPIDTARVRMDLAAAANYTNNPGLYTDTLTFLATATF